MDVFSDVPADSEQALEFDQAFQLLQELVDLRQADELQPLGPGAVYLASVVLWLLVYQRLGPRSTLKDAVRHLQEIAPHLCPDNRRIREETLSGSTAAYSAARQWLSEETVEWFAQTVSQSIYETTRPTLGTRRVFLVDGTTLTAAPEKSLRALYPPARNPRGTSAFPVVLMAVAHELESGCALLPEIGAMYGPQAISEVELARACIRRLPRDSVVLADAGFGIFSTAWAAVQEGHSFLLRMTPLRFKALLKEGTVVAEGEGGTTYSCLWKCSRKVSQNNPWISPGAELTVRLHVLRLPDGKPLYLVTNLPDDATTIGAVYIKRMDVETDISNIKIVLDTENIRARSPSMFRKELLASMVAYNLVVQFRRQAAQLAKVPPRRLSFTDVWTIYRIVLLSHWSLDPADWRARYRRALHRAMRAKLPNRPGRSYARETYRRAPKSAKFKKRRPPPF